MKKDYRVIIPPIAKESLREIVEYIKIESPSAAIKVKKN
jgi:plasmid stabilization system protein ParE